MAVLNIMKYVTLESKYKGSFRLIVVLLNENIKTLLLLTK